MVLKRGFGSIICIICLEIYFTDGMYNLTPIRVERWLSQASTFCTGLKICSVLRSHLTSQAQWRRCVTTAPGKQRGGDP